MKAAFCTLLLPCIIGGAAIFADVALRPERKLPPVKQNGILDERGHALNIASEMFGVGAEGVEVTLADETRCDILTPLYAIEVEWAGRHWEAPAQATWYAILSDRKPGVVLLVKTRRGEKVNIIRCAAVCSKLGIKFWIYEIPLRK